MTNRNILYRIHDAEGDLLYVGATTNPGQRFEHHYINQPWWDEAVVVSLVRFETIEELAAAEVEAIQTEGAKYNLIHSPQAMRAKRPRGPQGEGTVFLRADGLWTGSVEVISPDGKRKQKRVYSKNREAALEKFEKLKRDVAAGLHSG